MNNNAELRDTISFDEYKAWLTGLLRGKGNQLPDLNDWKAIKKMTDKVVVPDAVEAVPYTVTWEDLPMFPEEHEPCGSAKQDGNNITIRNDNSSVSIHDDGGITITGTLQTNGLSIGDKFPVTESYDGVPPEGNFVITGSLCGGDYGCYGGSALTPHKTSIEDYHFDTSAYTIISAGFDTIKKQTEEE